MLRVAGKKLGALTLVLDALKGAIPVIIAFYLLPSLAALCGLCAMLGHVFPVWLKFKGGKGVATALGAFIALSVPAAATICIIWLILAFTLRYSSAAALAAFAVAPIVFYFMTGYSVIVIAIISLCVWIRHKENIRRLLSGTESRIGAGSKAPKT